MKYRYILFLIIPIAVNAGFYSEEYSTNSANGIIASTLLFGLEPDAASEAMGKTSSGAESSSRSAFYNPAYVCLTNGVKISGTCIWNNLDFIHPKHFMINGGISYSKFLNAEVSSFNLIMRDTLEVLSDEDGHVVSIDTIEVMEAHSIHSLYYGTRLPFGLCIGTGASVFRFHLINGADTYFEASLPVLDIGFFYPLNIQIKKRYKHSLLFDGVYKNLFDTKVHTSYNDREYVLPIELILGFGYEFDIKANAMPYDLSPLNIIIQSRYLELINSKYNRRISFGLQLSVFEMAKIRIGYYFENLEKGSCINCKESVQKFTFGFGFYVPLFKLLSKPYLPDITVDLASFKRPSVSSDWFFKKNFVSITTSLNWRVFQNRHSKDIE